MRSIIGLPAVAYGGHEYLVGDLVLVAMRSGHWAWLESQARAGCAAHARGERVEPEALRDTARLFRANRDLLSANSLQAWLDERQLTPGDWLGWLERSCLVAAANPNDSAQLDPEVEDQLDAVVRVDLLCSGVLRTAADALLANAVAGDLCSGSINGAEDIAVQAQRALGDPVAALAEMPQPGVEARLAHLAQLEAASAQLHRQLATSERIDELLHQHEHDWTEFRWEQLTFPNKEIAAEVVALATARGVSTVGEAAAMLDVMPTRRAAPIDDVEPELARALARSSDGELVGEIATDDGWLILSVHERVAPSRLHGAAFARALDVVRAEVVGDRLDGGVQWSRAL